MFTAALFIIAEKCKTSCPSTDKWITSWIYPHSGILFREGMKYWHTLQHGRTSQTFSAKEDRHKGPHILWFLIKTYRTGKPTQAERVWVIAGGWTGTELQGQGFLLRWWKCPKTWLMMAAQFCEYTKPTELYTSNGETTVCDYLSIKHLKTEGKQNCPIWSS